MTSTRSGASVRFARSRTRSSGCLPTRALLASTRSDPAISVARLRARGALTEIRARELAFTVDEARELIVREGIELSDESVELLVERTEGWPAGLYLAALWLRDLEDPDEGVRAFVGSTRHVADYLTDEVLTALAPQTRDFLVRTAVLERFTPELCDAVLGREDSAAVLAEFARSNMFLVALDAREQWYRYHHLFGELLQLELGREDAAALRRRAAAWCREQGLVEDAIEYAAAAGDAETVAELLVEHDREFVWGGRLIQFLGWVRRLPSELLLEHPSLPAGGAVAAALLARPEVEVQRLLAVAERARRERPELWSPYAEAIVEVTRAAVIERGDVGAAVEHARRAVAAARAGADVLSVGVLASLAQALFFAGELDEARRIAVQAIERPDAPDVPDGYVGSLGLLALLDAEQGRTESAEAWARQAIGFARPAIPSGFLDGVAGAPWACAGVRRDADASTRPSARRCMASVCDARRSPPSVTRTPCSCSRRSASLDRGWSAPPATSNARTGRSRGFPIRGGYPRSRPPSSRTSTTARAKAGNRHSSSRNPARPSSPCCGTSRPVSPSARSACGCTSR